MLTTILILITVFIIATIGLAFYMGWFNLSSRDGKGTSGVAFTVDEAKMTADKNKVADKLKAS
jgi:hypothetical protein